MSRDRFNIAAGPTPDQAKRRRRIAGTAFTAAVAAAVVAAVPGLRGSSGDTDRAKPSIEPPAQGYNAEQLNRLTEADVKIFEDPSPSGVYTVQEGDTPESIADAYDHDAIVTSSHARELIIGAIKNQASVPGVLVEGQSLRPPHIPVDPSSVPLTGAEAANNAAQVAPQAGNSISREAGAHPGEPVLP